MFAKKTSPNRFLTNFSTPFLQYSPHLPENAHGILLCVKSSTVLYLHQIIIRQSFIFLPSECRYGGHFDIIYETNPAEYIIKDCLPRPSVSFHKHE